MRSCQHMNISIRAWAHRVCPSYSLQLEFVVQFAAHSRLTTLPGDASGQWLQDAIGRSQTMSCKMVNNSNLHIEHGRPVVRSSFTKQAQESQWYTPSRVACNEASRPN